MLILTPKRNENGSFLDHTCQSFPGFSVLFIYLLLGDGPRCHAELESSTSSVTHALHTLLLNSTLYAHGKK